MALLVADTSGPLDEWGTLEKVREGQSVGRSVCRLDAGPWIPDTTSAAAAAPRLLCVVCTQNLLFPLRALQSARRWRRLPVVGSLVETFLFARLAFLFEVAVVFIEVGTDGMPNHPHQPPLSQDHSASRADRGEWYCCCRHPWHGVGALEREDGGPVRLRHHRTDPGPRGDAGGACERRQQGLLQQEGGRGGGWGLPSCDASSPLLCGRSATPRRR